MKIFVFAYDRYTTMTTTKMLDACGLEYITLVHKPEDLVRFQQGGIIKDAIVTNLAKGLPYQRNYALEMLSDNEWALFLVDDMLKITEYEDYDSAGEVLGIDTTNSTEFGRKFKKELDLSGLVHRCEEIIAQADNEGAHLAGFACYNNPLFRNNKWKRSGLVDGRCILVKKSRLRYDTNAKLMDDYCFTALNLKEFGKVLVNQWILPEASRYTEGGCGTKEERMQDKMNECRYLISTYPDFIRIAEKKDWPYGSHVQIINKRQTAEVDSGQEKLF